MPTINELYGRAQAVRWSVYKRACRAYSLALGGDGVPTTLSITVIQNSILAHENGEPWRGVDYSKMRLARRLCDSQHAAETTVSRLVGRLMRQDPNRLRSML